MATRETDLPGVGTKHTLELASGDELVVVEHRVGHWEIARNDADGGTTPLLKVDRSEAAELGRILSHGQVAREDERKQHLFEAFCIEWVELPDASELIDQSLASSGIRARTGASVIAILRGEASIASPAPETRFQAGDTLVLVGQQEQVERFLELFGPHPSAS